jgi:hypothetical protein
MEYQETGIRRNKSLVAQVGGKQLMMMPLGPPVDPRLNCRASSAATQSPDLKLLKGRYG